MATKTAPSLQQLRVKAKDVGVPAALVKAAGGSAESLQALIAGFDGGKPAVKKSAGNGRRKAAPVSGRNSGATKRQPAAPAKRGPGRPPKAQPKATNGYKAKGGRNLLEKVNFNDSDGWNARTGSAPDRIIKALKKFKGDRTKTYNFLLPNIGDFVGKTKSNGSKWVKGEREQMLRYRIARTAWDFAIKTEQHEKAENRVEYGTGGTGAGVFKPAKAKPVTRAKKAATTRAKAKATTRKAVAKATPARRGRPPGSKNKPKAATKPARKRVSVRK